MVHFQKIENFVEEVIPARAKGTAYRLPVGFPTFVAEGEGWVEGHLVRLKPSDTLFNILDSFHGFNIQDPDKSLYLKKVVDVQVAQGMEPLSVLTYVIHPNHLPPSAKLIPQNDWRRSLAETPALTSLLTERQATYIRRLGKSTGRDIVPIDKILYRELINLEIIIDKGRRLALTRLGQEVYRYL